MTPAQFRRVVWNYYKAYGRHDLPWRKSHDPYRILVSEVMLQQTQVERVIPFYQAWMKKFPTAKALAKAPLGDVLKCWQGLGYNSRAKRLQEAGKIIAREGFPKTVEGLEKLPGIGPYTARAVMAFAYNEDSIFIETNIRTAVIHHFFPDQPTKITRRNIAMHRYISDKEIFTILEKAHPKGKAREWYAALMDYGAHLKRSGVKLNAKAKGYTKQSTFEGSSRQARGAILRALVDGPLPAKQLVNVLGTERSHQMINQLGRLYLEGLVEKVGTRYKLGS